MNDLTRQTGMLDVTEAPVRLVPTRWIDTEPVESTDKPCIIESLDVKAHICGLYADVAETLVIGNPNERDLSVGIAIPMPDRAVVHGYSLDIGGQLIDGVVVPKEKARVAFETEQRIGADPGLVEAVKGNVYRTRVYPVPRKGKRTVQLRYVSPLLVVDGRSAFLDVPMPAEELGKRTVHVDVELLDCPAPELSGVNSVQFKELGTCWSVESQEDEVAPDSGIRVALPTLPQSFSLVERDEAGDVWFCASERASEPDQNDAPAIASLTVLWDTSGSRASVDHEAELELLRGYCASDSIKLFRLISFSDCAEGALSFAEADELLAHINSLRYDGGSDFQALSHALATLPDTDTSGACVLFTDGMDTLSDEAVSFPRGCKVLAVVSGTERDTESLRQACGGLAFDVAAAPKSADALARALFCPSMLTGVEGDGIAEALGIGSGSDGRFTVVGKLAAESAGIAFDNTGTAFALDASKAREGSAIAHAWAALRVAQLSPRADDNADDLLALGRRFGIVSPVTSLLVLERLDQWLRYDIEPPTTWESMHRAWEVQRQGVMRKSSEQALADSHLRNLKREWASLQEWWSRDYPAQVTNSEGSPFCPSCGTRLITDSQFCHECGTPIPRRLESIGSPEGNRALASNGSPEGSRPLERSGPRGIGSLVANAASALTDTIRDSATLFWSGNAENARSSGRMGDGLPRAAGFPTAEPMGAPMQGAMPRAAGFANAEPEGAFTMADSEECILETAACEAERVSGEEPASTTSNSSAASATSVNVQAWMPDAAYLSALDEALHDCANAARAAYFQQRPQYVASPSFFIDCAGWFMANGDAAFGVRALTNLAELRIEDAALLRVMAWRLREAGELGRALIVLRRVLKLRPEDSQSHRDIALVLDELARKALFEGDEGAAKEFAEEAGTFYRTIALTPWQRRALSIGLFAVEEYNALRAWVDSQTWKDMPQLESLGIELEGVLDCDLRITLAWDADETDVDLHVTEPTGEEAYYGHRLTYDGGRVSEDITDGYGPELYEIRHARDGVYTIRAHYYASHQQTVFGPASCTLTVYTDWGRPTQRQQITSTRLENEKQMVPVGTAAYGNAASDEPGDEPSGNEHAPAIVKGSSAAYLVAAYGTPAEGNPEKPDGELVWELPGGRMRIATIVSGKTERVIERMPWGETLVIVQ